jgi:ribosomal protein S18 acetylase RimI-like enzyme
LAIIIWREHYIPIVGESQVDYMLQNYQSSHAISQQVQQGFEYFILVFKELPVGYLAFKKEGSLLFLSKLYVMKEYRGNQIGKNAMKHIENVARELHLSRVSLTVNINNHIAIKAYEALGFINVGPQVTDIGNGFIMDDYRMEKAII